MLCAEFESVISMLKWSKTLQALDHVATVIRCSMLLTNGKLKCIVQILAAPKCNAIVFCLLILLLYYIRMCS